MLSQLIFVREGHQTPGGVTQRALEHVSILSMLRRHVPSQVILSLEGVRTFRASEGPRFLMHRLDVRVALAWFAEIVSADLALVL